jgi:hypothetical protein
MPRQRTDGEVLCDSLIVSAYRILKIKKHEIHSNG